MTDSLNDVRPSSTRHECTDVNALPWDGIQQGLTDKDAGMTMVIAHSFCFVLRCPFLGCETAKDQQVVVVERCDNKENYHFVGSHKLKKLHLIIGLKTSQAVGLADGLTKWKISYGY